MTAKQRAFERWKQWRLNHGWLGKGMDLGWRKGYSAGLRAEKRERRSHDPQYKLEQIDKMIDRQERAAKRKGKKR